MARLPTSLRINARIEIPARELSLSYAGSSGPGGQHVNRTLTKVVLRWNVARSGALRDDDRARLQEKLASRLTREGDVLVTSERHRDQGSNVEDALERLAALVRQALRRPRPRRATRPTRASRERRLESKRRVGRQKRERRGE